MLLNKIVSLFRGKEEPTSPPIPAKYDRAFHFCDIYLEFTIKFMFIDLGEKSPEMMRRNAIMTRDSLNCLRNEFHTYGDELYQLIATYSQDEALRTVRQVAKANNRTLSPVEEKRFIENATEEILSLRLRDKS